MILHTTPDGGIVGIGDVWTEHDTDAEFKPMPAGAFVEVRQPYPEVTVSAELLRLLCSVHPADIALGKHRATEILDSLQEEAAP